MKLGFSTSKANSRNSLILRPQRSSSSWQSNGFCSFYSEGVILIDYLKNREKNYQWKVLCIRIKTIEESNQMEALREVKDRFALTPE